MHLVAMESVVIVEDKLGSEQCYIYTYQRSPFPSTHASDHPLIAKTWLYLSTIKRSTPPSAHDALCKLSGAHIDEAEKAVQCSGPDTQGKEPD